MIEEDDDYKCDEPCNKDTFIHILAFIVTRSINGDVDFDEVVEANKNTIDRMMRRPRNDRD